GVGCQGVGGKVCYGSYSQSGLVEGSSAQKSATTALACCLNVCFAAQTQIEDCQLYPAWRPPSTPFAFKVCDCVLVPPRLSTNVAFVDERPQLYPTLPPT